MADSATLYRALLDLSKGKEKSRRKVAKQFLSAPVDQMCQAIRSGLKSDHPKVRRSAFALIGEIQDADFIPDLLDGLSDPHADVVQMAVWAIGRMKVREAIPSLCELLKKGSGFKVTKTVIWAFGEIGDPTVLPLLLENLKGASSRLCEGILVCAIKLGKDVFVELLKNLDCRLPAVQSALHDFSLYSRKMRKVLVQQMEKRSGKKEITAIIQALPHVAFQNAEYKRLLRVPHENVRSAVYQSIANSALPKGVKQSYLLKGLDDASNRVVITALENLFPYMLESKRIEAKVQEVSATHPSPKVRLAAKQMLDRLEQRRQLQKQVALKGHFLLETLPGLEPFVFQEAERLGIELQKRQEGEGWIEVQSSEGERALEELKKLHTISGVYGIVSVKQPEEEKGIHDEDLKTIEIGNRSYEVVPLLTERDFHRPYRRLLKTSLDWRVARAMVLCSDPEPEDVFVDPTCGSGTLLLDRACLGPYRTLIGGDLDPEALSIAKQNLKSFDNVQIHRWDAASLPLPGESVSVAVANLPFGRRVGNHETNVELYPRLLQEIWRVLRTGGRAVLLTQEVTLLLDTVKSLEGKWVIERDLSIQMGGLNPHIICLRKLRS